jgi:hypothetical protein
MRRVNSAIASIDPRTCAMASPPTSGTMIGGCGATPEKTMELGTLWPFPMDSVFSPQQGTSVRFSDSQYVGVAAVRSFEDGKNRPYSGRSLRVLSGNAGILSHQLLWPLEAAYHEYSARLKCHGSRILWLRCLIRKQKSFQSFYESQQNEDNNHT